MSTRSRGLAVLVLLLTACSDNPTKTPDGAVADHGTTVDQGPVPESGLPDHGAVDRGTSEAKPGSDQKVSLEGGSPTGDPSQPGSFKVVKTDTVSIPQASGRSSDATLCAPSTDGTTIGAGPYPLVILSPGFMLGRDLYTSYCTHLASWGFLVIARDYSQFAIFINHDDQATDTGAILDWALGTKSPFAGKVDTARLATAGHSLGGKISILSAIKDARIKAVVGFDPVDANNPSVTPEQMTNLKVPLGVLGETTNTTGLQPCAPADNNFEQYYNAAGSPALQVTVTGADHMDWLDNPSCGLVCSACPGGTANDQDVKSISRRTATAFLRRYLFAETKWDTYLTGAVIQADKRVTFKSK